MKLIAVLTATVLFAWAALVAQTGTASSSKKTPAKKMVSNAPHKSAPVKAPATKPKAMVSNAPKKSGAGSTAAKRTATKTTTRTAPKSNAPSSSYGKNRKYARPAPARYSVQNEPTADRYREIQQALKAKGYLQADPTGKWDPSSTDALRRFQQDQNLEASGKLDSLSLIALGLGPKRTANAQARP